MRAITDIVECVVTGGWPICLGLSVEKSARLVKDYLDEIRRVEIKRVGKARHNPEKVGRMLTSLARNVSTAVSASTIASDSGIQDDTVREYLDILVRLMIVEPQPVWPTHLRSRTRLRKSPKWHFVDPSLAVAALGGSPELLLKDLEFFGFLFESLVIRDLRVFAQAMDAKVFYYRDALDLEVDAIVEVADGRWGVFEIKLGEGGIDKGAEKLLEFAAKVDTGKHGKPAVLGVIVGKGYGYLRDDGVSVIPIGALGP